MLTIEENIIQQKKKTFKALEPLEGEKIISESLFMGE